MGEREAKLTNARCSRDSERPAADLSRAAPAAGGCVALCCAAVRATSCTPLALAILLGLLLPAPAHAGDAAWLPLRPGERWEYRVMRDHQFSPANANIDRVFSEGTLVREVSGREGASARTRETLRLLAAQSGAREEVESSEWRWTDTGGLSIDRVRSENRTPAQEVEYRPPLRWLPAAPEPGARWQVGTLRWDGAEYALAAEVLGREDVVEGTSRWEQCLKVRYAGPITGSVPVHSGPAPIEKGRLERLVWYKDGVGIVREQITTEGELRLPPDGVTARVSEVQSRRLVNHRPGS